MDLHEIATEIAGAGDTGLHLRQGLVTAIAADGTVTVKIAGSNVAIPGVRAFSSAAPAVGAAVWLAIDGTLVLVIGTIGNGGSVPTGTILDFGGTTAPAGYLLCDGAAVSRTTYATLFAAISTNYGVGDGSTTFNVPNAKDRFRVGAGTSYTPGATGGEALHSLSIPELAAHSHAQYIDSSYNAASGGAAGHYALNNTGASLVVSPDSTSGVGSGNGHENRPPYLAATAIIKT